MTFDDFVRSEPERADEVRGCPDLRTLSGPPLTGGTAWVGSGRGPAGPIPSADAGTLWGNDGRLFAIAWQAGTTVGPVLRIAPIVGDQVIDPLMAKDWHGDRRRSPR